MEIEYYLNAVLESAARVALLLGAAAKYPENSALWDEHRRAAANEINKHLRALKGVQIEYKSQDRWK